MRVVADTNTVVSGFLWQGAPARLINAAFDGKFVLLATQILIAELEEVLSRPKFSKPFEKTGLSLAIVVGRYRLLVEMTTPAELTISVPKDADDDIVLACALGGKADYIVSGDQHLLEMGRVEGIPVITVNGFLERLSQSNE
jgi:putative PIN family toxin of toxin-antitoxin system